MKSSSGAALALMLLAGLLTAAPARAEDAPASCEVPAHLLTSESSLPKVAEAVKSGHSLDILVVGSRSSTINTSDGTAYPGRLQAMLRDKLPTVPVNVSVELQVKKTAGEGSVGLRQLLEANKPALDLWQTGHVPTVRSIGPDDVRSAV